MCSAQIRLIGIDRGSVIFVPLDPIGRFVHAAGTITTSNFKLDEALVAPAAALGVLNFPVVLVSSSIPIGFCTIGRVPVVNLALGIWESRGVANYNDSVGMLA